MPTIEPAAIHRAIERAAASPDGSPGYIVSGPNAGPYRARFSRSEVIEITEQVKSLNDSGAAAGYPRKVLEDLFNRGYDVIIDARPTQDAGWGLTHSALDDLRSELVILASNFEDVSAHKDLVRRARRKMIQQPPTRATAPAAGIAPADPRAGGIATRRG